MAGVLKPIWQPSQVMRGQWNLIVGGRNTGDSIRKKGDKFLDIGGGNVAYDTLAKAKTAIQKRHAKKIFAEYTENPSPRNLDSQIDAACDLYHRFTGHEPEHVGSVELNPPPRVGIVIGPCVGIAYEAVRDGVKEKYFHEFKPKARPLLVSNADGDELFILGGEFDFTEDGIRDR